MHPQVVQDSPGTCPICGMTLVLAEESESEAVAYPHQHDAKASKDRAGHIHHAMQVCYK